MTSELLAESLTDSAIWAGPFWLIFELQLLGDVQYSLRVSASEMTYIVSGGALNSTHSLTDWVLFSGAVKMSMSVVNIYSAESWSIFIVHSEFNSLQIISF